MKYCCYIWAVAPTCYLELLDKLQKWLYRTVGPSRAASPKPLAHRANVVNLSLFYRHYFGRYSSGSTGSTSLFLKEIYLLFQ